MMVQKEHMKVNTSLAVVVVEIEEI